MVGCSKDDQHVNPPDNDNNIGTPTTTTASTTTIGTATSTTTTTRPENKEATLIKASRQAI